MDVLRASNLGSPVTLADSNSAPALAYLDVIHRVKEATDLPVWAYHVSGEYAMVMAAAERGWIDGERAMAEVLTSIKRSGADRIVTYEARRFARRAKGEE